MRMPPHRRSIRNSLILLSALGSVISMRAQNATAVTEPPPPKWKSSAAAGLTLTRGNSETVVLTANIATEKKWNKNELALGADGSYGEQDDVKSIETVHGFGQYNRLFTERAFGLFRVDALHDAIANVEYRVTLSSGLGYYFIKNKTTFLRGEVGPGVVFEKQGGETSTYMTLRVGERFEHQLTKTAKLWQSVEILPEVGDWENYIVNAEIGVDVAINSKWSLRTYVQDTYDNDPAPDRKHNDVKLVAGVGYKF